MNKVEIIKQILNKVKIEDFFKQIFLVGSINLNDAILNDIDLVIVIDNSKEPFDCAYFYSEQIMALSNYLGIFVSSFFIQESTFQNSNSQFFSNVKNNGVIIYE